MFQEHFAKYRLTGIKLCFSVFYNKLRLLTRCVILVGPTMFGATFKTCLTCRTTTILRALRDGSLRINSLIINNCFSYRNILQYGVNVCQKCLFSFLFLFLFCFWSGLLLKTNKQKTSKFCSLWPIGFWHACGSNANQMMYGETLDFQCQHLQR